MTGRTRALLIALAVAIALAVVIWRVGGGGRSAPAPRAAPVGVGSAAVAGRGGARPALDRRPGGAGAPVPGRRDPAVDGDGEPVTRTYVMDNGAVVRDHRGGAARPPISPPPMRPDQRTMNTALTAKIYQQLAPMVAACGAAVPASDRGGDPFTFVTLTVKVDQGQLTTTEVYPTIHDITGASATGFPECVAARAQGISLASGDEPDHDRYVVQYPIRLR